MTFHHQQWADANQLDVVLDSPALQAWAAELGAPAEQIVSAHLTPIHMDPEGERLIVEWPAPDPADRRIPVHQQTLTEAVGVSLLRLKQGAQNRTAKRWGGAAFAVGLVANPVGEFALENDVLRWGGVGVMLLGGLSIVWAYTRSDPKAPSTEGVTPPIPLRQRASS